MCRVICICILDTWHWKEITVAGFQERSILSQSTQTLVGLSHSACVPLACVIAHTIAHTTRVVLSWIISRGFSWLWIPAFTIWAFHFGSKLYFWLPECSIYVYYGFSWFDNYDTWYIIVQEPMERLVPSHCISNGPLASYVKLRVAHAPGMPVTFSPHACGIAN